MANASGGCPTPTLSSTYYGNDGPAYVKEAEFTFEGIGTPTSNVQIDVSNTQVVATFDTPLGVAVSAFEKSALGLQGSFYLSSLGNCSGDATLLWDSISLRWLIISKANTTLCLYLSAINTTNILTTTFTAVSFDFSPHEPKFARLGLWPRVYHLTLSKAPLFPGDMIKHLCILNRTNIAQIFCAAPLNGLLGGFPAVGVDQSWTPAHGVPSVAIESSGTGGVGALFMRPIDDELHEGSTITPSTDQIEVEHWTNIQFGPAFTATYTAVRYKISVADFNSTISGVPTTMGNFLDRRTPFLMHRLQFSNNNRLVSALSSANGSAMWFQLVWQPPAPLQPPRWLLAQQGSIPNAFLPAIASDANGNLLMSFAQSSSVTPLSFLTRGRYASDPLGQMREELLLQGGDLGSPQISSISGSSISFDSGRTFFTAGQVASAVAPPWRVSIAKVRLQSQTIVREWKAIDACNNFVICNQTFLTV